MYICRRIDYTVDCVRRYFHLVTFVTTPIARLNPVHTRYPMSMHIAVTQTPALPHEAAPESGERYGGNSNAGLGAAGGVLVGADSSAVLVPTPDHLRPSARA